MADGVARTIFLAGLMGAGKSSVARELGKLLGAGVVDSDEVVEREAGTTVAEIFAAEGEAGFRARERAAVVALAERGGLVVALGGGALAQPGLAELLCARGVVVYLRARAETLARRVGSGAGRPLLAGLDEAGRLAKLRELLAAREPFYRRAQVIVDTDRVAPRRVAEQIAARVREVTA
jgi:shikimate kinase